MRFTEKYRNIFTTSQEKKTIQLDMIEFDIHAFMKEVKKELPCDVNSFLPAFCHPT